MKIALAAARFVNGNIPYNVGQMEKMLASVSGRAELICFGESFLQGFDAPSWQYEKDKAIAEPQDGPWMRKIAALSQQHRIDVAFGYMERAGETLYSSYAVLADGTVLHNYRRVSRGWKEYSRTDSHYAEGTETGAFSYGGHQVTVALCGDLWEHPGRFKTNDLLLWPVYLNFSLAEWGQEQEAYARQAALAAPRTLMVNALSDKPAAHGGAWYFEGGGIGQRLDFDREDLLIVEIP